MKSVALFCGLVAAAVSPQLANAEIWSASSPLRDGTQAWAGNLGLNFTVGNQDILVSHLGVYNNDGSGTIDGIGGTVPILAAIFDAAGNNVTGTYSFLGSGYAVVGGYATQSIGPTLLSANTTYELVAFAFNAVDLNGNTTLGSIGSTLDDGGGLVSYNAIGYDGNGSIDNPGIAPYGPNTFDAATMGFDAVPEPGTWALLGSALIGFGWVRRSRSRAV